MVCEVASSSFVYLGLRLSFYFVALRAVICSLFIFVVLSSFLEHFGLYRSPSASYLGMNVDDYWV